jgi:restriction endonuclease Mrr
MPLAGIALSVIEVVLQFNGALPVIEAAGKAVFCDTTIVEVEAQPVTASVTITE